MSIADNRKRLVEIIESLPENKLEVILDFAGYLKEKGESEDYFRLQRGSQAYQDWLSAENDVYDDVFKDELAKG